MCNFWNSSYPVTCNSCDHLTFVVWCFPSGVTTRQFVGHTKDVLSVAFSADNRQIVSGSRDKTIKLWNTLGVCKYTIQVSCQLMLQSVRIRQSFLLVELEVLSTSLWPCKNKWLMLGSFIVTLQCAGWGPLWVGVLCALLPQQQQPHYCLLRLGQDGQGMLLFTLPSAFAFELSWWLNET